MRPALLKRVGLGIAALWLIGSGQGQEALAPTYPTEMPSLPEPGYLEVAALSVPRLFDALNPFSAPRISLPQQAPTEEVAQLPQPVIPDRFLEIDLELDAPEKVMEVVETHLPVLEAAKKSGDELLLAYGYALHSSGRSLEAISPLMLYSDAKRPLSAYAALLLGEACLQLSQLDEAARWLAIARSAFPTGERLNQTRLGEARLQLARGDAAQAVKLLEQLLAAAPKSRWRYEIRLRLAEAYEKNGQMEQAIGAHEWLWAWAPASQEAEQSALELARFQEVKVGGYTGPNVAVRYRRALRLLDSGLVDAGLTLMLALAQDPAVTAQLPRSFQFELAKAYFQAKQYTEAAQALDQWYARTEGGDRSEVLFWRALTQGRLARFDEAVNLYRQLAREYPKSGFAETGLFKIGLLRLDQGDYPAAQEAFAAFVDRYPKSNRIESAAWYHAWTLLRQGKSDTAQTAYDDFVRRFPRSELVPGVRYWQGRMHEASGNKEIAVIAYRAVLQSSIPNHYAAMAEVALERLGQPRAPEEVSAPLEAAPALPLPHPEVLERINLLVDLGLRTWAQEELGSYEHTLKSRDEFLALADWYRRTGNYAGARLIAANMGLGYGIPKIKDPRLGYQLSYPLAFKEQLAQVKLPPSLSWELIYGVMRQESEFKPYATSKVGARGLMQVIPETALEVCQNRRLPPPELKQMYRPEVSVQYGAWHLEDLTRRLNGRLPLVIAGYNAGPEAVERWMKERPIDPIDVFMEEISYTETRRYVRRVLTNLWIYKRLHADGQSPLRLEPGLDGPIVAQPRLQTQPDSSPLDDPPSSDVEAGGP